MSLFNRKTLKRHIKADPIPADHLAKLEAWADLITSGRIEALKETALHGQFASKIVEGVLGYHGAAGGVDYNVSTEQNILRGSVDLALGRFGGKTPDIVAPFELKGADTRDLDAIMPGRNKSPVQQAWEYAMNARGVKWVLVSNMIELRFYGFGEGTSAYEVFRLNQLTDPEEYARFMLLLSAENLLSGRTADLLKESRSEDKDITDSLYQDYKDLRLKLLSAVQKADATINALDAIAVAQKILDRVLFIAFAEDTGLLPDNTLENAFVARDSYNPRPIWDNFKGLFRAISARGRCSTSRMRSTSVCCAGKRAGGRPPMRPRLRADANPSFVRSDIRSRSNCAIEAKTWKTRRPAGVVVSISSARDRNPAPRSAMASTMSRRSFRDLARRSYLDTTTISPSRS